MAIKFYIEKDGVITAEEVGFGRKFGKAVFPYSGDEGVSSGMVKAIGFTQGAIGAGVMWGTLKVLQIIAKKRRADTNGQLPEAEASFYKHVGA